MKTNKLILVAAVVTAAFTLSTPLRAQVKPETDDGIAASPKMRQRLEEQNAYRTVSNRLVLVAAKSAPIKSTIAASPRMSQMLAERGTDMNRNAVVANMSSTTAPPKDGIAASPKMRQWLDEHEPQFQVAPIK